MPPIQYPWDPDWVANEPRPILPYSVRRHRARVRTAWFVAAVLAVAFGASLALYLAPAVGQVAVAMESRR